LVAGFSKMALSARGVYCPVRQKCMGCAPSGFVATTIGAVPS